MVQQTNPSLQIASSIPANIAVTSDTVAGPAIASVTIPAPGVGFRIIVSAVIAGYQNTSGVFIGRTLRCTQNAVLIFSIPLFATATVNDGMVVIANNLELAINENENFVVAFGAGDVNVNQSVTVVYRIVRV